MWPKRWAKRRVTGILLALLVFLLVAGCGGGKKGSLQGTVYFGPNPMPGGHVTFITEKGGAHTVDIDPKDGTYSAVNLPLGKMKVIVQPAAGGTGGSGPRGGGTSGAPKDRNPFGPPKDEAGPPPEVRDKFDPSKSGAKPVPVPPRYRDAETTDLYVEVTGGEQTGVDIKVPPK